MHDSFDPYQRWLAIPPAEQPANHYRLLGLRLFESDQRIIARAAELRVVHLRACDDGVHKSQIEELLEKVDAASRTLLNPVLKQQYDNLLQRKGLRPTNAAPVAQMPAGTGHYSSPSARSASAPADASFGPTRDADAGISIVADKKHRKYASRRGFPWTVVISCAFGALVATAVILAALYFGRKQSNEPMAAPVAGNPQSINRAGGTAPESSTPGRPLSGVRPRTRWDNVKVPLGPVTLADLMEPDAGAPPDTAMVTGLLTAARHAMASRDLATARRNFQSARARATSSAEKAEVERVGRLLGLVEAFWQAVREEWAQLAAGQELEIGESRIVVVDNRAGELTVRAAGQNRSYTASDMPWKLAVALAEARLPSNRVEKNLHVGAFLAVDALGDRAEARRRWQGAGALAAELMPELELSPPVQALKGREPGTRAGATSPVLPGAESASPPSPEPRNVKKSAVPDADVLAKSVREIRELFRDDFRRATLPVDKAALASKLTGLAAETQGDAAGRFALCSLARKLAVEAGDATEVIAAIDEMGRHYDIDSLALKAEAISRAWRSETAGQQRAVLYQQACSVLQAALDAEHYAAADAIVGTALLGARSLRDYARVRDLEAKERQIRAALRGDGT